jgi:AraC-like DNA-binding protein
MTASRSPWNAAGTASAAVLRPMLSYARTRGVAVGHVLASVGLTEAALEDFDLRIPEADRCAVWTEAAKQAKDDGFGLRVAEHADIGAYDVLDYALYFSSTVGEAIDRILRFHRVLCDALAFRLETSAGAARLRRVERTPPAESEAVLAVLVRRGRELTGEDLLPREIRFAHAAPPDTRRHEAFFRCKVRFDCSAPEIVFGPRALDLAVRSANPGANRIIERYLRDLLARLPASEAFVERVRDTIARTMVTRRPTLEATARALHASPRTLQRRLAEHGTTYAKLVDAVRRDLAERLVREGRLSITEITFLLGFDHLSGFRRAFKRWTGRAPSRGRGQRLDAVKRS